MRHSFRTLALGAGLAASLTACETMNRTVGGDAGMRIQVDVYRGPLALDPEIQWGRLLGQLGEANTAVDHYIKSLMEDMRVRTVGYYPEIDARHPKKVCLDRAWTREQGLYGVLPDPKRIGTKELAAAIPDQHRLLKLLEDACETWEIVNDTQAAALVWTRSYDKYRGAVKAILRVHSANRVDVQAKRLYQGESKSFEYKSDTVGKEKAIAQAKIAIIYATKALKRITGETDPKDFIRKLEVQKIEKQSVKNALNGLPGIGSLMLTLSNMTKGQRQQKASQIQTEIDALDEQINEITGHLSTIAASEKTVRDDEGEVRKTIVGRKFENGKCEEGKDCGETALSFSPDNPVKAALTGADPATEAMNQRRALQGLLGEFVQVGTRLKTKAGYWSWVQSIRPSDDAVVRQHIAGFSILASEYSNRIVSASDALLKQTYLADRREMPISSLIRDTKPTHVASLLVFNHVAGNKQPYEGEDYSYDRLRTMEQIYGDDSWANINQAYASGRGDTAMAFIKDDVGNWNLKNFDQDPSEVVQTYKKMGLAALQTAMDLAQSAQTGGAAAGAKKMFELGNTLTMGGAPPSSTGEAEQITALNDALVRNITSIRENAGAEMLRLQTASRTASATLEEAKNAVVDAQNNVEAQVRAHPGFLVDLPVDELQYQSDSAKNRERLALERSQTAEKQEDRDKARAESAKLVEEIKQWGRLLDLRKELDDAKVKRAEAEAESETAKKALEALPAQVAREVERVLETHGQIITAMESGVAGGTKKTGAKK